MAIRRLLPICLAALPLLAAAPSHAGETSNRLVAGGATLSLGESLSSKTQAGVPSAFGETRAPLLTGGGFSAGALTGKSVGQTQLPFVSGGPLAVGGYVAYGQKETRLSSSLTSDGRASRADISAAYAGGALGSGNAAALSLGTSWVRPQSLSPNPAQPGASALIDPSRSGADLNLSFSLMSQMTPSLSFGGVAQASRSGAEDNASGFMLGAGLGLKF